MCGGCFVNPLRNLKIPPFTKYSSSDDTLSISSIPASIQEPVKSFNMIDEYRDLFEKLKVDAIFDNMKIGKSILLHGYERHNFFAI